MEGSGAVRMAADDHSPRGLPAEGAGAPRSLGLDLGFALHNIAGRPWLDGGLWVPQSTDLIKQTRMPLS